MFKNCSTIIGNIIAVFLVYLFYVPPQSSCFIFVSFMLTVTKYKRVYRIYKIYKQYIMRKKQANY